MPVYKNFYLTIIGIVLLMGLFSSFWFMVTNKKSTVISTATSTAPLPTNNRVYTNDEYGFKLSYPEDVSRSESFVPFSILGESWRVFGKDDGIGVVQFPTYSVYQGGDATGKAYPLFFQSLLRVGVSTSTDTCYDVDEGFDNQPISDATVNGVPFKKISFRDAATMKYIEGESYRTVHNGTCYVLEQIKVGSNYRDDQMATGTPEDVLDSYYDRTTEILYSFTFTN